MKPFIKKQLNPSDRSLIMDLKNEVERQRTCQFKLAPDFVNQEDKFIRHLLYFSNDSLSAYAFLSFYDETELEATIISQNEPHVLHELIETISQLAQKKNYSRILFITDPKDEYLNSSLKQNAQLKKQFTEYRLVLQPAKFKPINTSFILRKATINEAIAIAKLQFGTEDPPLLSEDLEKTFVFYLKDQLIACVRIEEDQNSYGIYGFVVDPAFRGQGLGKICLNNIIQQLLRKKEKEIYLEVDSTNEVAYHLYVKMGFEKKSTFDYYEQALISK